MLTLAFDTCNNIISTAILQDNKLLRKNNIYENSKQAELLIPEIEKILKENNIWYQDLDLITTINGPGSFTSVRIGLACAKIIKITTQKPLILLDSCEVIARKYINHEGQIIIVNDAKMNEFFVAKYFIQNQKIKTITKPMLLRDEEVSEFLKENNSLLCGTATKNNDKIEADIIGLLAYEKFQEGYFNDDYSPLYLRSPKIEARKK